MSADLAGTGVHGEDDAVVGPKAPEPVARPPPLRGRSRCAASTRTALRAPTGAGFGLTPRRYPSGEVDRSGRITKRGDGTGRTLLDEAADVLLVTITRSCDLRG